jgi:hypothetical protein
MFILLFFWPINKLIHAVLGLITLIFLLATVYSIVFGFRQKENVLVIPIAGLFAFTQLRTSMPGAPNGFGMTWIGFQDIVASYNHFITLHRRYHWLVHSLLSNPSAFSN